MTTGSAWSRGFRQVALHWGADSLHLSRKRDRRPSDRRSLQWKPRFGFGCCSHRHPPPPTVVSGASLHDRGRRGPQANENAQGCLSRWRSLQAGRLKHRGMTP
jgi:hypothetical protein